MKCQMKNIKCQIPPKFNSPEENSAEMNSDLVSRVLTNLQFGLEDLK